MKNFAELSWAGPDQNLHELSWTWSEKSWAELTSSAQLAHLRSAYWAFLRGLAELGPSSKTLSWAGPDLKNPELNWAELISSASSDSSACSAHQIYNSGWNRTRLIPFRGSACEIMFRQKKNIIKWNISAANHPRRAQNEQEMSHLRNYVNTCSSLINTFFSLPDVLKIAPF